MRGGEDTRPYAWGGEVSSRLCLCGVVLKCRAEMMAIAAEK